MATTNVTIDQVYGYLATSNTLTAANQATYPYTTGGNYVVSGTMTQNIPHYYQYQQAQGLYQQAIQQPGILIAPAQFEFKPMPTSPLLREEFTEDEMDQAERFINA